MGKTTVLTLDLSTVNTKVHIISAQAVWKIHALARISTARPKWYWCTLTGIVFALLLTFNHKRT